MGFSSSSQSGWESLNSDWLDDEKPTHFFKIFLIWWIFRGIILIHIFLVRIKRHIVKRIQFHHNKEVRFQKTEFLFCRFWTHWPCYKWIKGVWKGSSSILIGRIDNLCWTGNLYCCKANVGTIQYELRNDKNRVIRAISTLK